ncbi:hypothetical protein BH24CHL9_BH24CHL9_12920 [soil metagenome]
MDRRLLGAMTAGLLAVGLLGGTALGAHKGNNRANLTGTGDPDASGHAIVNYSEGRGTFNGTITVADLVPGETYTFLVRLTGEQVICSGTANSQGTFRCSEQHLVLSGFGSAVVRDSGGVEVASGLFARRGNCRDPNQAGSQCKAQNP